MSKQEFRVTLRQYLDARRRGDGYNTARLRHKLETTHALDWNAWREWNADPALSGRAEGRPASTTADRHTRRAERIARGRARRARGRRPLVG